MQHIGGYIASKDVTSQELEKRRHVEEQSKKWFRSVCETLNQPIWTSDPTGMISWCSTSWLEFTGASLDDVKGTYWANL